MKRKNKTGFNKKIQEIKKTEKEFIKTCENNFKKNFRKPQLTLEKSVYITDEAYKILREQKIEQKKSMALITCELIIQTYGKKQNSSEIN